MTALSWLTAHPIAHRGLHDQARGIPENTLAAARAAIAGGFAIECDVRLSRDGTVMVFHDDTLDRLTGQSGRPEERSADELDALAIFGSAETVPTLQALLDLTAGRAALVIEVKSRFDGDEEVTRRVVDLVAGREQVAVKSFDPTVVACLRRIAPHLPRGIVAQSNYDGPAAARLGADRVRELTDLLHWPETQPHFLSWRHSDLPKAAPFLSRLLGDVPVMTWTIRSEAEAAHSYAHADQIVFEGFAPGAGPEPSRPASGDDRPAAATP